MAVFNYEDRIDKSYENLIKSIEATGYWTKVSNTTEHDVYYSKGESGLDDIYIGLKSVSYTGDPELSSTPGKYQPMCYVTCMQGYDKEKEQPINLMYGRPKIKDIFNTVFMSSYPSTTINTSFPANMCVVITKDYITCVWYENASYDSFYYRNFFHVGMINRLSSEDKNAVVRVKDVDCSYASMNDNNKLLVFDSWKGEADKPNSYLTYVGSNCPSYVNNSGRFGYEVGVESNVTLPIYDFIVPGEAVGSVMSYRGELKSIKALHKGWGDKFTMGDIITDRDGKKYMYYESKGNNSGQNSPAGTMYGFVYGYGYNNCLIALE